jgi:hypothetical protein
MTLRTICIGLAGALLLSFGLSAADLTGAWKADLESPHGPVVISYAFTQDGDKLTGTMQAGRTPQLQLENGKVEGDKVSFSVKIADTGLVFAHTGKVSGDEISFTIEPSGEFPGAKTVAKRVKQ